MATIENVKEIAQNYYKPTPTKWRKIGDAIQWIGDAIALIAFFSPAPWITPVSMVVGRLGKTITNFAVE